MEQGVHQERLKTVIHQVLRKSTMSNLPSDIRTFVVSLGRAARPWLMNDKTVAVTVHEFNAK